MSKLLGAPTSIGKLLGLWLQSRQRARWPSIRSLLVCARVPTQARAHAPDVHDAQGSLVHPRDQVPAAHCTAAPLVAL